MKYLVLIQARCGSNRLPNKVLKDICGKPDLQWVIERVSRSTKIDEVMVITSIEKNNLSLIRLCTDLGIRVFVGSEGDVLDRYYQAAKLLEPEYVIRITADCPLFDWHYLDMAIDRMTPEIDYLGVMSETFPDGLDLEIFTLEALKKSWREAEHSFEREHVTQYMIHHPELFKQYDFHCPIENIGDKRWTLDEEEDFELIEKIYKHFVVDEGIEDFVTEQILEYLHANPELELLNGKYVRNEGLAKSIAEDKIVENEIVENKER